MQDNEHKNSLYSFLGMILAYRKLFIIVFLVSSIASVTISLLLPNWYRSSATLVPPKGNDLLSMLSAGAGGGALQKIAGLGLGGALQSMGAYNYMAILESRDLKDQIIDEFNLVAFYEMEDKPWEKVHDRFSEHYGFEFNNEGYLTISYEDKDPDRSAIVTKRIVELLNEYSFELANKEASANRAFLEEKILIVQDSLKLIETEYADYFRNEEFIFIPENVNTGEGIADLYTQKKILEVEYALMKNRLGEESQRLELKKQEIDLFNEQIRSIPDNIMESIRIYREYLVLTSLLEYLVPALEQAKLEQVKNTPVILVLDEPKIPEYKSRPKRSIICIVSVMLAMISAFSVVLIRERIDLAEIIDSQHDFK